ncbi:MAG: CoA transferase [Hyphomicrobiales bacterium]|nr:CoA transferase [Hyphomicrobiales bacterium]
MSAPLAGVRIVEFAGIGPAPFAAMMLADLGADILRIDRPGGADPWTGTIIRRGRRTLTCNLKDRTHLADVISLCSAADAVVEGFRPGVMERLGLGPAVLMARNPRLVYARMTGWGQDGPLARTAGHDITYIALSGALHAIGPRERPIPPLNLLGDMGGGALYLVAGLLAAILSARATGHGRIVDCAITDCTAHLMAMIADLAAQGRWDPARRENNMLDGAAPFYRSYPCADGRFLAVGALEPVFFAEFCRRIGLDPISEAERLDRTNWPALTERIAARLATRTRDEWAAILGDSDACAAPVLTLDEAAGHPHNRARGVFATRDGISQPAPAPRFDGVVPVPPPLLPDFPDARAALAAWGAG